MCLVICSIQESRERSRIVPLVLGGSTSLSVPQQKFASSSHLNELPSQMSCPCISQQHHRASALLSRLEASGFPFTYSCCLAFPGLYIPTSSLTQWPLFFPTSFHFATNTLTEQSFLFPIAVTFQMFHPQSLWCPSLIPGPATFGPRPKFIYLTLALKKKKKNNKTYSSVLFEFMWQNIQKGNNRTWNTDIFTGWII